MKKKIAVLLLVLLGLASAGFTFTAAAEKAAAPVFTATTAAVNITAENENSIVKIMNDIVVPAGETVDGDVVAIMGDIRIDGVVKGNVVAILGDVELNNTVEGDLVSVLGRVTRGPEGKVYGQTVEATRPADFKFPHLRTGPQRLPAFRLGWSLRFFNVVMLFGLAALALALLPNQIEAMAAALEGDAGRKLLVGFIALLLIPAIFFVSVISLIGIPLVPVIALLLIVGKFLGYVAIALYVGKRVQSAGSMAGSPFLALLIGVLGLWLLRLVPFAGWLSALVVTMFALGLIIDTKFGTNRPWFKRKDPPPAPPAGSQGGPVIDLPNPPEDAPEK